MRNHMDRLLVLTVLSIHGWALRKVVGRLLGHSSSKSSDSVTEVFCDGSMRWETWTRKHQGTTTACQSRAITDCI